MAVTGTKALPGGAMTHNRLMSTCSDPWLCCVMERTLMPHGGRTNLEIKWCTLHIKKPLILFLSGQRIAAILFEKAMLLELTPNTELVDQIQQDDFAATRQLFAQQPKGRKLKPPVSEYHQYIAAFTLVNDEKSLQHFLSTLPKGAKVCHQKVFPGGVSRDDTQKKYCLTWFSESFGDLRSCELKFIGLPREPKGSCEERASA